MTTNSGKRLKILVSCVTFETVKITDAASYYNPDRIYLIHYVSRKKPDSSRIYTEFYEEVVRKIVNETGKSVDDIIEIEKDVSDYSGMMSTVHWIVEKENANKVLPDIYVNVSAGSSDYVAAASMVSMMYENVIPFTVKTKRYTVDEDHLREYYYSSEGDPVGMAQEVFSPMAIPKISVPRPEKNLILALRTVSALIKNNNRVRASKMIYELKIKGLWLRKIDDKDLNEKSCPRNDLTYFHRDFMDKWIHHGWIEKDEYQNTYRVTDEGNRVLSIFYKEE